MENLDKIPTLVKEKTNLNRGNTYTHTSKHIKIYNVLYTCPYMTEYIILGHVYFYRLIITYAEIHHLTFTEQRKIC